MSPLVISGSSFLYDIATHTEVLYDFEWRTHVVGATPLLARGGYTL